MLQVEPLVFLRFPGRGVGSFLGGERRQLRRGFTKTLLPILPFLAGGARDCLARGCSGAPYCSSQKGAPEAVAAGGLAGAAGRLPKEGASPFGLPLG